MLFFADKLTLDAPRRTSDGYMAIRARAARTGVYQYLGREVDPEGQHFAADAVVNVYRPADEVFDAASLGSFVGKPITDDHPAEGVNSSNWRDLARGTIMGATRQVVEDGEYVNFDLAFLDAELISKIEDGKRELSNGYAARLDIEDGTAPDGTAYQAVQRQIRGNHVAVVDAGRAGPTCRIGDAAKCGVIASDAVLQHLIDERTYDAAKLGAKNAADNATGDSRMPKIILVDGHQIDIANVDTAEATIKTLQQQVSDAKAATATAQTELATLATDKATLEAKLATVEQQLADAKPSPADLRAAAKSYADASAKAKALGVEVDEDDTEDMMKRKAVKAKMGDVAANWNDDQIAASFLALTRDVKPEQPAQPAMHSALDAAISGGIRPVADAKVAVEDLRRKRLARMETAYMGQQA